MTFKNLSNKSNTNHAFDFNADITQNDTEESDRDISLGKRELVFLLIVHLFVSHAHVNLCHFFTSSWCQGLAATSARGSSWTFLFTFFGWNRDSYKFTETIFKVPDLMVLYVLFSWMQRTSLHHIFCAVYPEWWSKGLIVHIHNVSDPKNLRGITLVSTFAKIFSLILRNRLNEWY